MCKWGCLPDDDRQQLDGPHVPIAVWIPAAAAGWGLTFLLLFTLLCDGKQSGAKLMQSSAASGCTWESNSDFMPFIEDPAVFFSPCVPIFVAYERVVAAFVIAVNLLTHLHFLQRNSGACVTSFGLDTVGLLWLHIRVMGTSFWTLLALSV